MKSWESIRRPTVPVSGCLDILHIPPSRLFCMRLRPFGGLGHSRSSPLYGSVFPQKESMLGDRVIDSTNLPGLALEAAVILSAAHSAFRLLDSAVRLKPVRFSDAVLQASSITLPIRLFNFLYKRSGSLCILPSGAILQLVLFGMLMQRFIETH
jgi:hypothetical protein